MAKALESYRYGDPADVVDRIRASDAARTKRKAKRQAERTNRAELTKAERTNRAELTQEEMQMIPAHWLVRK
jgi:hypothetical protein